MFVIITITLCSLGKFFWSGVMTFCIPHTSSSYSSSSPPSAVLQSQMKMFWLAPFAWSDGAIIQGLVMFTCHRSVTIKLQARSFFTWYWVSKAAACLWRSWTGSYRWRIEFTVTRGTHSSTAEDKGRKTRITKTQHLKWPSDLCCSQRKANQLNKSQRLPLKSFVSVFVLIHLFSDWQSKLSECLSVWKVSPRPSAEWVLSGYSGFLPQCNKMCMWG